MISIRIGIGTPPSWHEIDGADDVVGYDVDGSVEGMKEGIKEGADDTDGFNDGANDDVGRYEIDGFAEGVDVHDELKGLQIG